MKVLYRKRLIRSVLSKIDDGDTVSAESVSRSVTVLDAIHFVNLAVKDIQPETVEKCFRKAGVLFTHDTAEETYEDDDVPLAELVEIMRAAQGKIQTKEAMTAQDFAAIDTNAPVHEELDSDWEKQLVSSVQHREDQPEQICIDEEEDIEPTEPTIKSNKEALQMVENLKLFTLRKDLHDAFSMLQSVQELLEKDAVNTMSKAKQTSIAQFFTPKK